jgi:hypothetical protein
MKIKELNRRNEKIIEEVIVEALKPFRVPIGFCFLQNQFLVFTTQK